METSCLITKNHEGKKVIFTEKQRILHSSKHPELRDIEFINGRVKRAIESPDFIYQDLAEPKKRQALYIREFNINGMTRYTKVVILITPNPYIVITAFRPSYVKERGKTQLLYGKDA